MSEKYQELVHNVVSVTHTESIRRIIIRLVYLEKLDVAPDDGRRSRESEQSAEEEIILEKVSTYYSERRSRKRIQEAKSSRKNSRRRSRK